MKRTFCSFSAGLWAFPFKETHLVSNNLISVSRFFLHNIKNFMAVFGLGLPTSDTLYYNERRFRQVAEAMPTVVWSADASGYIDWYNSRWYEVTGQSHAEAAGWGWENVHHTEDLAEAKSKWILGLATGKPFEMTFRLRNQNTNAYRWYLTRIIPMIFNGKIVKWYGTNTDIHEAKENLLHKESVIATLMKSYFQESFPIRPNITFDATYKPASGIDQVGGDWYDVFEIPGGNLGISLGDVGGHGVNSAVTMGRVKFAIQNAAAVDNCKPAGVLERANRIIRQLIENPPMVTAFFGILNTQTFKMTYVCAGHLPPICAELDGTVWSLPTEGGFPLGIENYIRLPEHTVQFSPNSLLALFTDGLVEYNHDLVAGENALKASVAEIAQVKCPRPAHGITNQIFKGEEEPQDDVALLTISFGEKMVPRPDMEIVLPASIENAALARESVSAFMAKHEFTEDESFATLSACGEAIINVCEHAYRGRTKGNVIIRGYVTDNILHIEVEDTGGWKRDVQQIDPDDVLADRGRGILMMKLLTDEVVMWSRMDGGGTVVRLTKLLGVVPQDMPPNSRFDNQFPTSSTQSSHMVVT